MVLFNIQHWESQNMKIKRKSVKGKPHTNRLNTYNTAWHCELSYRMSYPASAISQNVLRFFSKPETVLAERRPAIKKKG